MREAQKVVSRPAATRVSLPGRWDEASSVGQSCAMGRRSERTSGAVERAGCEREPQSGRELDERLHGWPFCGDGEGASGAREARVLSVANDEAGKIRRSNEKTHYACRKAGHTRGEHEPSTRAKALYAEQARWRPPVQPKITTPSPPHSSSPHSLSPTTSPRQAKPPKPKPPEN